MTRARKPDWQVIAHGTPLDPIDDDLMAQIVIMLGRELAQQAEDQTRATKPRHAGRSRARRKEGKHERDAQQ